MQYEELAAILRHVGKDPTRLVFEDELTGIRNRRFLMSYLEHKVDWRSGDDFPLSLLSVDLDHFKQVNDTHGHDTGDRVLTWVATLLTTVAGDGGFPFASAATSSSSFCPGPAARWLRPWPNAFSEAPRTGPSGMGTRAWSARIREVARPQGER